MLCLGTTCITLLDDISTPYEEGPYKLETALDLRVLVLVARCEASLEKAWTASLPQASYDYTTRGMHVHPSSEHLASLAECFLSSAATAADAAVRPQGMGLAEKSQKGQRQQVCHRANSKQRCQQNVCAGAHVPVHCQLLPWH